MVSSHRNDTDEIVAAVYLVGSAVLLALTYEGFVANDPSSVYFAQFLIAFALYGVHAERKGWLDRIYQRIGILPTEEKQSNGK